MIKVRIQKYFPGIRGPMFSAPVCRPRQQRCRWSRWAVCLLLIAALGAGVACAPRLKAPEKKPQEALFEKAMNRFEAGKYDKAFDLYNDYLSLYPEGRHVPMVLLKTAGILAAKNQYSRARGRYQQLVRQYPRSALIHDVKIGIMRCWYKEQRYDKVLSVAETVKDEKVSADIRVKKYSLLVDTYLAQKEPVDAAYVLVNALKKLDKPHQKRLMPVLDRVVDRVVPETLRSMLDTIKDVEKRGRLTCRIAQRCIDKDNFELAADLLAG